MNDFIANTIAVRITGNILYIRQSRYHGFAMKIVQGNVGGVKRELDLIVLANNIQVVIVKYL